MVLTALVSIFAAAGCGGEDEAAGPVTWSEHVAPIVAKRCSSCHIAEGIAPFDMSSFTSARDAAGPMIAAVEQGRMPPWSARETDECQPSLGFEGDLRLPASELATLKQWVSDGTLEGDPAKAAPLPEPPRLSIDDPSLDLSFPVEFTVDGTSDHFECFVLDPGTTEKKWITEIQLTAGNRAISHHGLIFLDFKGESEALAQGGEGHFPCFTNPDVSGYLLGTWTPGAAPVVVPERAGMPVYPESRIVVQMHYHPTGKGPEKDRSSVQLKWVSEPPELEAAQALVGNFSNLKADGTGLQAGPNDNGGPEFRIPANATGHVETMIYEHKIPLSMPIYSVGTHMHYVGTDMKIEVNRAFSEPASECLVQTPAWDFNWQRVYQYNAAIEDLPRIGPGDRLTMRCVYDNTMQNPFVARALKEKGAPAPQDVMLGEQTLDEMCLGVFGLLVPPGVLEELF